MFRAPLLIFLAATVASCSPNDSTGPAVQTPLEQQVWASALGINLSSMTKLTSGVYYADQQVGSGAVLSGTPTVRVFYTGFLANGSVFDTNVGRTVAVFPLSNLISGWQSGMQGMRVGGKRRLVIPSSLGYGATGSPPVIPAHANLVFDIELTGIG